MLRIWASGRNEGARHIRHMMTRNVSWEGGTIVATLTVLMLAGALITIQPVSVAYIVLGLTGGWALLLGIVWYRQRRLAVTSVPLDKAHLPRLLILWVAVIGFAVDEDLTFDARTSLSDYVLPFLVFAALGLARKQNMPFVPPRAKPWMFLVVWINAIALVLGAWRVGSMTVQIVLATLIGVIVSYAIVCAVYSAVSDIESVEHVILALIVTGSIWNLVNLIPYLFAGGGRLNGTLLNAGATGNFASVIWICQLAYLMSVKNGRWRLLGALNLLLLSATILFSGARGAWVAMMLVLPFMLLLFANARMRAQGVLMLGLLVLSGSLLLPWLDAQGRLAPVWERFNLERGITSRVVTSKTNLELWASSPITMLTGIGTGVFRQQYAFTQGAAGSEHNTYISLLVNQGPVGLIGWLAVLFVAWRGVWVLRHTIPVEHRWLLSAVLFSLLAVLVEGVPRDISNQRFLWLLVGLALAMGDKLQRNSSPRVRQSQELSV